jgi:small-conductance mechanosensitive channel
LDELEEKAYEYWDVAVGYIGHGLIFQIVLIVVLFGIAWFISNRVEPHLEAQARRIKGMPGMLRLVVAFLRRMEWLFFILLLAIAYLATTIAPWPENNYLTYAAMLLAAAWLVISVASHVIRKPILRRMFAVIVWTFAAAAILGIVDDVAAILDGIGFNLGDMRFSVLTVMRAIVFLSVLMWAATSFGNFLDKRIQTVDQDPANCAGRIRRDDRDAKPEYRPDGADRPVGCRRRRHRFRSAESCVQLHLGDDHPARPVDQAGRHDHAG